LSAEATYKTIGLDASIITLRNGQQFILDDGDAAIFYGRAKTSMSFTMLEVPLYVKYRFNDNNRVFLGGYYSWMINGKFLAEPVEGRLEKANNPSEITIVNPGDMRYDFNDRLNCWDAGWLLGYERRLFQRITLSGRLSMGVKDIFKPGEKYLAYSMWHMRGTLTVSYRLF
ncbi:MAG: PorT family protein, partial [Rikenellaceae bacterium]|nr:PorT family protein [Rikenellaceae bacterium]